MRLYDCFELEDSEASTAGATVRATDLRSGEKILLHRWRPEQGELLADQQKAMAVCEPEGPEFFCDGKSLWLVQAREGDVATTLAKLRGAGLFTTSITVAPPPAQTTVTPSPQPPAAPPVCVQCGSPHGTGSQLCAACLKKAETKRPLAVPGAGGFRGRARALLAALCVLAGIGLLLFYLLWPQSPAPTATFSADRLLITKGECVHLSWSSTHGRTASIAPGLGPRALSGQARVCPIESTNYNLAVLGPGGNTLQHLRITVLHSGRGVNSNKNGQAESKSDRQSDPQPPAPAPTLSPPVVSLTAEPSSLRACESATLHWTVEGDFNTLTLSQASTEEHLVRIAPPSHDGAYTIHPLRSARYRALVTWNGGGPQSASADVQVLPSAAHGPPACGEIIWTGEVPANGLVTIDWSMTGAQSSPQPSAPIVGSIPHWRVRVITDDSFAKVVSQPVDLGVPRLVVSSTHRGLATIHLQWSVQD